MFASLVAFLPIALATSVSIDGDGDQGVSVFRPTYLPGVPSEIVVSASEEATLTEDRTGLVGGDPRYQLDDGGWLAVDTRAGRYHLYFEPDWTVDIRFGDPPQIQGDGVAELTALIEAQDVARTLPASKLRDPARAADALRKRLASLGASDTPAMGRAEAEGLATLLDRMLESEAQEELVDSLDWYLERKDAMALPSGIVDVPGFWAFGSHYGHCCTGTRKFGAVRAALLALARTDHAARDPVMVGMMEWTLETLSTAEDCDAAQTALALWKDVGALPEVWQPLSDRVATARALAAGQTPPDLTGFALDGMPLRLVDLVKPGRPTVLYLWGTWCGACIGKIPEWNAATDRYGDQVDLVAIAVEKAPLEKWQKDVVELGWGPRMEHLYVSDEASGEYAIDAIEAWPAILVLDSTGTVYRRMDRASVDEVVAVALSLRESASVAQ